ncbi:hypothetical protein ASF75_16960 [Curtobacterium sp. Leaf154]|nr:hypothetical protein ASF75_16960 [Curtobacterium sp. Leaf154]
MNRHELHIDYVPSNTAHRTWTITEHFSSVTVGHPAAFSSILRLRPGNVRAMTAARSRRRRMRRRQRPPRGTRRMTWWEWSGLGTLVAVTLGLTVAALILR